MSRRKELRVKAVLPVKVTGVDASARHFSLLCHTLDLTYDSARIAGISVSLMRGQTVFLQRFGVKAKFKVYWEGSGTRKGHYGLKALETEKALWGISLPQRKADEFWTQPTNRDRRRFPRYPCSGGLEIITVFEFPFWAELTDISATGVYAKTPSPLPPHTLTRIRGGGRCRELRPGPVGADQRHAAGQPRDRLHRRQRPACGADAGDLGGQCGGGRGRRVR